MALRVGCTVVVDGLKGRPELNGRHGRIDSYSADTGRYKVTMADGDKVAIKPPNLCEVVRAPSQSEERRAASLPSEFAMLADAMPSNVRKILVDGVPPSSVPLSMLARDLQLSASSLDDAHVMRRRDVLSAEQCRTLREAIERERSTKSDSVDGGASPTSNAGSLVQRAASGERRHE